MKTPQLKSVIILSISTLIIAICGTNMKSNASTPMVKPQGTIIPFSSDIQAYGSNPSGNPVFAGYVSSKTY